MKTYSRPVEFAWWLTSRAYFLFVVRELTSVFIAAYLVVVLILLRRLDAGPAAYAAYLQFLRAPGMLLFHAVALAAAVYHSVTWFRLAPQALVVRVGGRRAPAPAVVWMNYALWAAVSAFVAWLILGRGR